MGKLHEFGFISDITLLSSYSTNNETVQNDQDDTGTKKGKTDVKNTFSEIIKNVILAHCRNIIDEGVNLKKEMDELEKNEPMMYHGIKRYRDHLMHSARIALLGEWLMQKQFNYIKHDKNRCHDCLNFEDCQDPDDKSPLEEAINKLIPYIIVTSITDREKTSIPYNVSKDIYDYDRAFSYHIKKPSDDKLLKKIWFIAAINHDIGYSFTYIRDLFEANSMLNSEQPHTISTIKKDIDSVFEHLYDVIRTHSTSIDTILHDTTFKKIPHGVIGAFHVRNLIEDEYILDMASRAIARHDDDSRQICFQKEPICFLLALLDEIQEWGRPLKVGAEIGFDDIQSFSMKLFARCDLPYIKYYREHNGSSKDSIGSFVFELDYTISGEKNLERTKFSFPHFFFLKQMNLSRLINGPGIKVKIRVPPLAKEQFGDFKEKINNRYKLAAIWADQYLNANNSIEFDLSKPSEPQKYFDKRPPKIWKLILKHCKSADQQSTE